MNDFFSNFHHKFPKLSDIVSFSTDSTGKTISFPLSKDRYVAWIKEDLDGGFLVGINELHNHYDLKTADENFKDAIEEIRDIINDQVVAIGNPNALSNFLISTMELDDAISMYAGHKPDVELITYSKVI